MKRVYIVETLNKRVMFRAESVRSAKRIAERIIRRESKRAVYGDLYDNNGDYIATYNGYWYSELGGAYEG